MPEEQQEQEENTTEEKQTSSSSADIWAWVGLVIAVLIVLVIWLIGASKKVPAPSGPNATSSQATTTEGSATSVEPELGDDSTSSIQDQLEGVNVEDVEDEFEQIEQDLQNLQATGTSS